MGDCIYGPVPSRRLGRSLGVDLLPAKICTYDCIYCQLGRTGATTIARRPYRKAEEVLAQLKKSLEGGARPDCITIAGSGEPTLNTEIGTIIQGIKAETAVPVAVLTNSSLLSDQKVRNALMAADIVVPSLDAHSPPLFERVNRPHNSIGFERMVEGLVAFSSLFPGRLWLEIFILDGINASPADAARFKPLVDRIAPTDIYINTAVRPPAEPYAKPVSEETIDGFYRMLGARRQRDTIFSNNAENRDNDIGPAILAMAARRPVTMEDMAAGLEVPLQRIRGQIKQLLADRRLDMIEQNHTTYYRTAADHAES